MEESKLLEDKTRIPLIRLALPMLIENLIRTSLTAVDQFMLYGYSEKAAAAMSTVSQWAFFIQLVYMMVSIGTSICVSQRLGAAKPREAGQIALASLGLILLFSAALSAAVLLLTRPVLALYRLEPYVEEYAVRYLLIYGGCSVFTAINIVQSTILRSYGYAKDPMVTNALALALNIIGNAISLYGPFGLPVLGVTGVAISTVFSQFVALWFLFVRLKRHREIDIRFREILRLPASVFRGILAIGVPTAGENLSYNVSQIIIVGFVAKLGTQALAAYGLVITLARYVFIFAVSLGGAAQIKVGYFVGAGKHQEAARRVWGYFAVGFAFSLLAVLALNLIKRPLIGVFTQEASIVAIALAVLAVEIFLEPGRSLNTILIPALKGAGDVRFPVVVGIVFMWGIGVVGAWFFGIHLGWGLPGIWFAMGCDEWIRGLVVAWRWKSGAWKKKSLIAA